SHYESLAEPVTAPLIEKNAARMSISSKFLLENAAAHDKQSSKQMDSEEQKLHDDKDKVLVNDGRLSTGTIVRTIQSETDGSKPSHPPPVPPEEGSIIFNQLRLIKSRFTDFKREGTKAHEADKESVKS